MDGTFHALRASNVDDARMEALELLRRFAGDVGIMPSVVVLLTEGFDRLLLLGDRLGNRGFMPGLCHEHPSL